jgi:hypothetical protein
MPGDAVDRRPVVAADERQVGLVEGDLRGLLPLELPPLVGELPAHAVRLVEPVVRGVERHLVEQLPQPVLGHGPQRRAAVASGVAQMQDHVGDGVVVELPEVPWLGSWARPATRRLRARTPRENS